MSDMTRDRRHDKTPDINHDMTLVALDTGHDTGQTWHRTEDMTQERRHDMALDTGRVRHETWVMTEDKREVYCSTLMSEMIYNRANVKVTPLRYI